MTREASDRARNRPRNTTEGLHLLSGLTRSAPTGTSPHQRTFRPSRSWQESARRPCVRRSTWPFGGSPMSPKRSVTQSKSIQIAITQWHSADLKMNLWLSLKSCGPTFNSSPMSKVPVPSLGTGIDSLINLTRPGYKLTAKGWQRVEESPGGAGYLGFVAMAFQDMDDVESAISQAIDRAGYDPLPMTATTSQEGSWIESSRGSESHASSSQT